jgi:hypothetical protein
MVQWQALENKAEIGTSSVDSAKQSMFYLKRQTDWMEAKLRAFLTSARDADK